MITDTTVHQTASAVVLDILEEKVLLVWHNATGKWLFPGGHVDEGEDPRDAAAREVLEETGVTVVISPVFPIQEKHRAPAKLARPGKPSEVAHWHDDLLFIGFADSHAPLTAALDEVAKVQWVPIGAAHLLKVRDEVPERLAAAWTLIKGER